jgi:uncharacterized protein
MLEGKSMDVIQGEVSTSEAGRILGRLCKHWSHKFVVRWDDAAGEIQLNDVRVVLRAAPDRLFVTLENSQAEVPRRLMGVVADHLQRMAADPTLQVIWSDPDSVTHPNA